MPTQMNFDKGPSSYGTSGNGATVQHAQSNFDGGRTTKKGGTKTGPQQNFPEKLSINVKTKTSHFGEKSGTGCNNGY